MNGDTSKRRRACCTESTSSYCGFAAAEFIVAKNELTTQKGEKNEESRSPLAVPAETFHIEVSRNVFGLDSKQSPTMKYSRSHLLAFTCLTVMLRQITVPRHRWTRCDEPLFGYCDPPGSNLHASNSSVGPETWVGMWAGKHCFCQLSHCSGTHVDDIKYARSLESAK